MVVNEQCDCRCILCLGGERVQGQEWFQVLGRAAHRGRSCSFLWCACQQIVKGLFHDGNLKAMLFSRRVVLSIKWEGQHTANLICPCVAEHFGKNTTRYFLSQVGRHEAGKETSCKIIGQLGETRMKAKSPDVCGAFSSIPAQQKVYSCLTCLKLSKYLNTFLYLDFVTEGMPL